MHAARQWNYLVGTCVQDSVNQRLCDPEWMNLIETVICSQWTYSCSQDQHLLWVFEWESDLERVGHCEVLSIYSQTDVDNQFLSWNRNVLLHATPLQLPFLVKELFGLNTPKVLSFEEVLWCSFEKCSNFVRHIAWTIQPLSLQEKKNEQEEVYHIVPYILT